MSLSTTKPMPGINFHSSPRTPATMAMVPEIFTQKPPIHPEYHRIKEESLDWMNSHYSLDDSLRRGDFAYLAAVIAERAGPNEFRTVCDWFNWAFLFADAVSNCTRNEIEDILETMDTLKPEPSENLLVEMHRKLWLRIAEGTPERSRKHYKEAMTEYMNGQVDDVSEGVSDIETYLNHRRKTIAVRPCLALLGYCYKLDIPEEVLSSPAIQRIEEIAKEIILLQNDVLSYRKEQSTKLPIAHNIIALYRQAEGISAEAAQDKVDAQLLKLYREWYVVHTAVPGIDQQVELYLKGCRDIVVGSFFHSQKCYGLDTRREKRTWLLPVIPTTHVDLRAAQRTPSLSQFPPLTPPPWLWQWPANVTSYHSIELRTRNLDF